MNVNVDILISLLEYQNSRDEDFEYPVSIVLELVKDLNESNISLKNQLKASIENNKNLLNNIAQLREENALEVSELESTVEYLKEKLEQQEV